MNNASNRVTRSSKQRQTNDTETIDCDENYTEFEQIDDKKGRLHLPKPALIPSISERSQSANTALIASISERSESAVQPMRVSIVGELVMITLKPRNRIYSLKMEKTNMAL